MTPPNTDNPPAAPGAAAPPTPPAAPPTPPAAAPASPAVAPLLDDKGNLHADFPNHPFVPEVLRQDLQLATHAGKPLESLLNNWSALMKMRGDTVIPIPGESAEPEKWDTVFDRLGRPANADGYVLPDLAESGLDPKHKASDEFTKKLCQAAYDSRITGPQFTTFVGAYNKLLAEEYKTQQEAAQAALVADWGTSYQTNKDLAEATFKSLVRADDVQALTPLLDLPAGLRLFHSLSTTVREGGPDLGAGAVPVALAEAAKQELDRMNADVTGALHDDNHPGHAAAVKRFKELDRVVEAAKQQLAQRQQALP